MKAPGFWVTRWLAEPRIEGPITPYEAGELLEALICDGEYRRAHALADLLTKRGLDRNDSRADWQTGQLLGMRTVLFAVNARAELRRAKPPARRKPNASTRRIS